MKIHYTTQFKKDYKRLKRQHKDLGKLEKVIRLLVNSKQLEPQYRDHQLTGKWENHRDCHLEPDWLVIYRITGKALYLERTGSHSELFKKCNSSPGGHKFSHSSVCKSLPAPHIRSSRPTNL